MDSIRYADLTSLNDVIIEKMLSGEITTLMPLSVSMKDDKVYGCYRVINTLCISNEKYTASEILEITGECMRMLEELRDYLINPEDIILNEKVLFRTLNERKIKICLIPITEDVSEKENVSYLLKRLSVLTDERGKAYLNAFHKEFMKKNLSLNATLSLIEAMKREAKNI